MNVTIAVRRDALDERMKAAGIGTQDELARRMGMNPGGVSRVLADKSQPGHLFIARLIAAIPGAGFDDLFEIVPVARRKAVRTAA